MIKNLQKDKKDFFRMKSRRNSEGGFTIIEVLIVLAIAGLIMLIVFLAVPALQRNSRNTQRKNDISAVLGSVQEHANNNGGQLPATAAVAVSNAKLGFYADTDFTGTTNGTAAQMSITPTESTVVLANFAKCPAANPAPGPVGALAMGASPTKRNFVAVYRIETSGQSQTLCQDL